MGYPPPFVTIYFVQRYVFFCKNNARRAQNIKLA